MLDLPVLTFKSMDDFFASIKEIKEGGMVPKRWR